jgi:hypothetical protein
VKKTTDFEYTIVRAELNPAEYFDYIKYFINVDKLFNVRFQKFMATHDHFIPRNDHNRCKNLQRTLIKHIHYIFERSTRRFPQEQSLWESHMSFLTEKNSTNLLDLLFGKLLSLFPKNVNFWIQASTHELHANNNMHAARVIMQRGLRSNENNKKLWKHFFDLELYNVLRIKERRKVLGINTFNEIVGEDSAPDSSIYKPLLVIFKHYCQSYQLIDNSEFPRSIASYDSDPTISERSFYTSELWSLMEMVLGFACCESILPDDWLSYFRELLIHWKVPIDCEVLIKLMFKIHHLFIDTLNNISTKTNATENSNTTQVNYHEFEHFGLLLNFQTLMWKTLNDALAATEIASSTRSICISLVGSITVVVLKHINGSFNNLFGTVEDSIGEVKDICHGIFVDYGSGILRHNKLDIDGDEAATFQKLVTTYNLKDELEVWHKEVEANLVYFCGGNSCLSLEKLLCQHQEGFTIGLCHKISSLLCASSIASALKNTTQDVFDGCNKTLSDWVDSSVQHFKISPFANDRTMEELIQFTETLSAIFVHDKRGIVTIGLIDKFFPIVDTLTCSPRTIFFVDDYFIPNLKKLSVHASTSSQSKVDSFFRSFLVLGLSGISNTEDKISNKTRSLFLLKYLKVKLELFAESGNMLTNLETNQVEELYNWAISYIRNYGMFLVVIDNTQKSTKRKYNASDNGYCIQLEIAHMFFSFLREIEGGSSYDNADSATKSKIALKRRILEELSIRFDSDSIKLHASSDSERYNDMMKELAGIYRTEGSHERGNNLLCKIRRV